MKKIKSEEDTRRHVNCVVKCWAAAPAHRPPSPPHPPPHTHLLSEHWRLYYSNCYYRKNESVGVTGWGGNRCFHSCRWAQTNIWSRCGFSFSYLLVGIREEKKNTLIVSTSERTNQRCIDAWILQYFSSVTVNEHFSVVSDIHRQITCTWCQEPTFTACFCHFISVFLSSDQMCEKKTKLLFRRVLNYAGFTGKRTGQRLKRINSICATINVSVWSQQLGWTLAPPSLCRKKTTDCGWID